ncbi:MAG: glycosyltransferase [Magnetococcales bacterium]|nr:glycosyltransferase [Magnetococcales bacterium]
MEKIMKNPVVLCVIPVHDRPRELETLLESLARVETKSATLKIAIVDDGSPTPLRPIVETRFPHLASQLNFFRNDVSKGPGSARNLAVNSLESDFIWFLDSDTEVGNPKVMDHMVEKLLTNPSIAAAGGPIEMVTGEKLIQQSHALANFLFIYSSHQCDQFPPTQPDTLSSCNLLIKREHFNSVGGFDTSLKMNEDAELSLALRSKGLSLYQSADTVIFHHVALTGRESGFFEHFRQFQAYVYDVFRARIYIICKYNPKILWFLPILDLFVMLLIFINVKRGVYTIYRINIASSGSIFFRIWILFKAYIKTYISGIRTLLS